VVVVDDLDANGAFLLRHLRISVVVYVVAALGSLAYLAATPDRPHRGLLELLALAALVAAVGVVNPLGERLIASPRRTGLLYGWSAVTYGFIGAMAFLDGGVHSAFLFLLFLALQYVAMAYPTRGVVGFSVGAVGVVAVLGTVGSPGTPRASSAMAALVVAIAGLLSILSARNREEAQERQDELHVRLAREASIDSLTGCLNRRSFDEVLADELERAVRHDRHLSLMVLDIDGFKSINDTHGHPIGDAALRSLADVLHAECRAQDLVARIGGDEFAVVLPETEPAEAEVLAERVEVAVAAIVSPLPLSISVGVAGGSARRLDAEELVCVADAALYRRKGSRPSRWVDPIGQAQADASMPPVIASTIVEPLVSASGHPTLTATIGSRVPGSGQ
jgi:diguanylate cyclase (GGDEF)-like protein